MTLESNPLIDLLRTPLPSKNVQRKELFRPTRKQINDTYDLINSLVFDNKLKRPSVNLRSQIEYGWCIGHDDPHYHVKIKLRNKFYCIQWFIMILAHEMAHQYQWEFHSIDRLKNKQSVLLSHGKTFFEYKKKLAEFDIPLKSTYNHIKWFKHQILMKL